MKKTYIYIYTNIYILHSKNSALPVFAKQTPPWNHPVFKLALSVRCFFGHSAAGCVPPAEGLEIIPRSLEEVRASQVLLSCFSWGSRPDGQNFWSKPPFGCTNKFEGKKQDQLPINWCRIVSILDNLKLRYYVMSPSSKSVILLSKSLGPFPGGHHQNSHHPGCQDPDPLLHNGWGSYQTWVPWRRSSPATWWPPLPRCPCDRGRSSMLKHHGSTLHYQLESFK